MRVAAAYGAMVGVVSQCLHVFSPRTWCPALVFVYGEEVNLSALSASRFVLMRFLASYIDVVVFDNTLSS